MHQQTPLGNRQGALFSPSSRSSLSRSRTATEYFTASNWKQIWMHWSPISSPQVNPMQGNTYTVLLRTIRPEQCYYVWDIPEDQLHGIRTAHPRHLCTAQELSRLACSIGTSSLCHSRTPTIVKRPLTCTRLMSGSPHGMHNEPVTSTHFTAYRWLSISVVA